MLSANQIEAFFNHQYLRKESSDLLDFLHGNNHHRKVAYEATTFGWVCPVLLRASQVPAFFDHQYLWKQLIAILDFFHRDNHHRKVAYEAATFAWVCPALPRSWADCCIL